MPKRIYLQKELAQGKDVVLVGGACYERVGPSPTPPNVFGVEDDFDSCEQCEGSSSSGSSSSSSSASNSSSDASSSGEQSDSSGGEGSTSTACVCTAQGYTFPAPGGALGTEWSSFPPVICKGGTYSLSFVDPGGLVGDVLIKGNVKGGEVSIIDAGGGIAVVSVGEFTIAFGTSTPRTITIEISISEGFPQCVDVDVEGGAFSANGRSILRYPEDP